MDAETFILGAGPYGLSIAAHLRAMRRSFQILGTPLESWRTYMPAGMILKSEPFASNLWDPERRFTLQRHFRERSLPFQAVGRPLSLADFLVYADWFRERAVGDTLDVKVARVRRVLRGFELTLADGRCLTSRRLVLATGHMAFRTLPPEVAHLPEPFVVHSSRVGELRQYADKTIVIIGAGQSALETAALMHEAGAHVRILARRSQIEWNSPSVPRPLLQRMLKPDAGVAAGWKSVAISELPGLFRRCFSSDRRHRFVAGSYGPGGAWWLRHRVEGQIEVCLRTELQSATLTADAVILSVCRGGQREEIRADHVVCATGFRIDIARLDYLDSSLLHCISCEAQGIPALDSRFETSVPGLFIVGIASAPVFGPIMRFMYGAKHVGARIAPCLAG